MIEVVEKAKKIRLVIFDVDGVLTPTANCILIIKDMNLNVFMRAMGMV